MSLNRRELFVFPASARSGPDIADGAGHPLWRRMTWTSKAILAACARWEKDHALSLTEIASKHRMGIYYGTLFGEMEAGLTVAAGILKPDHVISPTAFQQSVHNAPIGYLTQILKTNAPTATIASGSGSFDRALVMAAEDLSDGIIDVALVINAGEYHLATKRPGVRAESEICVITAGNQIDKPAPWRLESIAWRDAASADQSKQKLYIEPLSLDSQSESFERIADAGNGRSIVSNWHKLPTPSNTVTAGMDLLPHRGPMLLIDRLTDIRQDGSAHVETTLRGESFLLFNDGQIRPQGLVEVLAQAAGAAFNAGKRLTNPGRKPTFGYLLSVDEFDASGAEICQPGDKLDIQVTLEADIFPVGKYKATAFLGTKVVATGVMKFISDEKSELSAIKMGNPT